MNCLNCGSSRVHKQIAQSPSDDFEEFWCDGCNLPVDAADLCLLERLGAATHYLVRRFILWLFMFGVKDDPGGF